MSLTDAPGRASPQPLPSLPPSPTQEEDLGRPEVWGTHNSDDSDSVDTPRQSKGKGKAEDTSIRATYAEGGTDEALRRMDGGGDVETYPPRSEDETETRRVEENLRRWEIAERQRRKVARESSSSTQSKQSVVADVARRASLLWPRRTSRVPNTGVGTHRALRTSDDAVPLDDIEGSPSPSAAPSPSPTPAPGYRSPTHKYSQDDNPFADPVGSSSSLFVNAQSQTATPDSSDNTAGLRAAESQPASGLDASDSGVSFTSKSGPQAPEPLGLPQPRSPPPRTEIPHLKRPPEPIPPPSTLHAVDEAANEEKPARWWTEWLCGCSEGPDRGGEAQAARTNPLE